jgi:hypothetical protein
VKLFHLYRSEDETGVSGTGPVVEGVEFTNGWCAIRWLSNRSTLCFYQSMADVRSIHGHGGRTELVVHDFEPARRAKTGEEFEIFLQTLEEISSTVNAADDPGMTPETLHASIDHIKILLDRLERGLTGKLGGKAQKPIRGKPTQVSMNTPVNSDPKVGAPAKRPAPTSAVQRPS